MSTATPELATDSDLFLKPEAGVRRYFDGPFLLDEGKLRKIDEIFNQYRQRLEIENRIIFIVSRKDKAYFQTTNINDVLNEANVPGKEIVSLGIEIQSKDPLGPSQFTAEGDRTLAVIAFRHSKNDVILAIDARDRGWCFSLAEELDTHIKRCMQGRPLLYRYPRMLDLALAAICMLGGMASVVYFSTQSYFRVDLAEAAALSVDGKLNLLLELLTQKERQVVASLPFSLAAMIVSVGFATASPLRKLIVRVNRSCFYWNDNIPRHDKLAAKWVMVKWTVIIGFLVSLAATLVGAWIIS